MSEPWNGIPLERADRDGWHWFAVTNHPFVMKWSGNVWRGAAEILTPQAVIDRDFEYLGLALTPAEVVAKVHEAELREYERTIFNIGCFFHGRDPDGLIQFMRAELARRRATPSS